MKKSYANAMLVFVTIVWGGGFLATNGALQQITPFYIMMIRFLGAAILPLLLCWKKLRCLDKSQIMYGLLAGTFLFGAFAFQTFGLQYTTPGKNAFLTASNVIFVPYLLWLILHRKPCRKEIIASILCVCGIGLLTLKPDALQIGIGDVLSIICAVFFALHIITLERYSAHCDPICMTTLQMLSAGLISTLCALLFETPPVHIGIDAFQNVLYLIFVSTLLAYLLQTFAQRYTSANSASMILSMEALFASIFSYFILGEVMSYMMLAGAGMIFASILYIEYKPHK